MKKEKMDEVVKTLQWVKTHHVKPHEYIVREKIDDDDLFVNMVKCIRENGVDEEFRFFKHHRIYRYLYLGGYKYWTMGAPIDVTIIINRQKI